MSAAGRRKTAAGAVQWDDASVLPVPVVTNQLQNSSFEVLGSGSPHDKFANWFDFNNCFVQPLRGHFGGTSAKAFGNWNGPSGDWCSRMRAPRCTKMWDDIVPSTGCQSM